MRDAFYFRKIKTDMIADNEDDEDASGESDGAMENENADTGALQKEKEQETPDENIEEAQRPRRTTQMPSYVKDYDI